MTEADTAAPQVAETDAQVTSNDAQDTAQGADVSSQNDIAAQLEAERKARQQAEMRARQLENERAEETRRKQEEEGRFKELYEAERARAQELEEQRKMDELMSQYDPDIQAVAKKLFSAGDLPSQMAALQEAIKQSATPAAAQEPEVQQPKVEAMNPNPREVGAHQSVLKDEMSLEEMAEALDKRLKGSGL